MAAGDFEIDNEQLKKLMECRRQNGVDKVNELGGVQGICEKLHTSPKTGLTDSNTDVIKRKKSFGVNEIPQKPPKSFFVLVLEATNDPTLILLMICALIILLLALFMPAEVKDAEEKDSGLFEGVGIFITVLIVIFVTAGSDYSKEKQFRNLQDRVEGDHTFSVIRNGVLQEVNVKEIVVGDIMQIKYGDTLPADGIIIQSNDLKIDESTLTGESDHVKKNIQDDILVFAGTSVMEGSARVVVVCVGPSSQAGIIFTLLSGGESEVDDEERSILQLKLTKIAMNMGLIGVIFAVLTFVVLIVQLSIESFWIEGEPIKLKHLLYLVKCIVIGITILVVAIPEGLPLAVTLSLAYSVKKMMDDNNLVRHLHACETMGNATTICSDKTGTLTTNRMTVVQSFICEIIRKKPPNFLNLPPVVASTLVEAISINTAYTSIVQQPSGAPGQLPKLVGNKTECALLDFVNKLGQSYEFVRSLHPEESFVKVYTFNSARKSMSTVITKNGGYRLYSKGASEIVLGKCSQIYGSDGKIISLTEDIQNLIIEHVVEPMANEALRTITIAYRDFDNAPDWEDENSVLSNMTCLAIVGIEDPVRPEVPPAIQHCQTAGITVRMVTGDNINTARSIALKCGILQEGREDFDLILEGVEFNRLIRDSSGEIQQDLIDGIWPRLKVLARSSPTDKYTLVRGIINSEKGSDRQIVAVTGDGTNDAPALKKADVGFAMGITGTDVAKQASDIILLDDNFSSMVKAVIWGRNVYDNVCKFIQFQLTVNGVAVIVAFVGACAVGATPLGAVQMLWVNIVMDTMGSLALSADQPTEELLQRQPYGRNKSLFSDTMIRQLFGNSMYQLSVILILLFWGEEILGVESGRGRTGPNIHFTVIFNTFVLMTLCNEIASRKLHGERNIFGGLQRNYIFILIWISSLLVQFVIVQWGGNMFHTVALDAHQWLWCTFFGLGMLVWYQFLVSVPTDRFPRVQYWELEQINLQVFPLAPEWFKRRKAERDVFWLRSVKRIRAQTKMPDLMRHSINRSSISKERDGKTTPRHTSF